MPRAADPAGVPEAWPQLMSREQLCAYLGGLDPRTLVKICPVSPVDLGANVLRYPKARIDVWIAGLPPRLPRPPQDGQGVPPGPAVDLEAVPAGETALEKARRRALGDRRCPTSARTSAAN